jgi:hypothetical protein
MDLLNENRSLIHAGKLLRQPDTGFEWNGWSELFVLLFDNYSEYTFHIPISQFSWICSGFHKAQGPRRRDQIRRQPKG